ncbi:MAG TPA: hypothetical protein VKP30_12345, partial [Polyangiaceae bacterium]|nr:hypothetical protein [Polyangiaceae bacterium]
RLYPVNCKPTSRRRHCPLPADDQGADTETASGAEFKDIPADLDALALEIRRFDLEVNVTLAVASHHAGRGSREQTGHIVECGIAYPSAPFAPIPALVLGDNGSFRARWECQCGAGGAG